MFKILLALHLLFAVFAVGPLVHAATTASRGIRTGDGAATASSARLLRIYGIASVIVVALGLGLMSVKRTVSIRIVGEGMPRRYADYLPTYPSASAHSLFADQHTTTFGSNGVLYGGSGTVADFSDLWIWLSLVLYVVATALVLAVLVPTLRKATAAIAAEQSVVSLTGRVAGAGGAVALLYAAIVFLMVYKPIG